MVTQNNFVIPAVVLEKFRSRGFPEGVTLTSDHCKMSSFFKVNALFVSKFSVFLPSYSPLLCRRHIWKPPNAAKLLSKAKAWRACALTRVWPFN